MNFIPAQPLQQRARGRLDLAFRRVGDATKIERFFQEGCLKARLPRAETCEVVTLNISGGVAGGDRLATGIEVGAGARLGIATQAAERIYRALAEPAEIATRIVAGAGSEVEYLPQETILFDRFGLNRSLEIELHEDAAFLGVESLVFGRKAMGEMLNTGSLRDRITLRRDNRLVLRDMTRLEGDIARQLGRPAMGGGAGAVASLILAGPGAAARLPVLRAALGDARAGASAFDGIIFARILAPDGASLRHCLKMALAALRDGRALPRVWQG